MINCLSYSLRFWKINPEYVIYYNSDHCINMPKGMHIYGFLPIEDYGYNYFYSWYKQKLINKSDLQLLKEYFNVNKC